MTNDDDYSREAGQDGPRDRAERLMELGSHEFEQGHWATSAAIFAQASEEYDACQHPVGQALALLLQGRSLLGEEDFDRSAEVFSLAARTAESADDRRTQAAGLAGRAEALDRSEDWESVREACDRALAVMGEYNHTQDMGRTLYLQARAVFQTADDEDALAILGKARSWYRSQGDLEGVMLVDDLGLTVCLATGRHEQGLVLAGGNVRASKVVGSPRDEAYAQRRLGEAWLEAGQHGQALNEFTQARGQYRAAGLPGQAAGCDVSIARTLRAAGELGDAIDAFRNAAAVFDGIGWAGSHRSALQDLGATLYRMGERAESASVDAGVIADVLDGDEPLSGPYTLTLIRCISALISSGDAQTAGEIWMRAEPAILSRDDLGVVEAMDLAAAGCWVAWHTDREQQAAQHALGMLEHAWATEIGLGQAWILQIAGTAAADRREGAGYLARAMAVYRSVGEHTLSADVGGQVLAATASWHRLESQAAQTDDDQGWRAEAVA